MFLRRHLSLAVLGLIWILPGSGDALWGLVGTLGGSVSVDSAPGRGTTFSIRMPVVAVADIEEEDDPVVGKLPQATGLRILVVDDEPRVLELVPPILAGHTVVTAAHGGEGLARLAEADYDIVLSDWVMAEASGLEVAAEAKARNPDTVTVLMTGWDPGGAHSDHDAVGPASGQALRAGGCGAPIAGGRRSAATAARASRRRVVGVLVAPHRHRQDAPAQIVEREGRPGVILAPGCDFFVAENPAHLTIVDKQTAQSLDDVQLGLRVFVPPGGFLLVSVRAFHHLAGGYRVPLPTDEAVPLRLQTAGVVDLDADAEVVEPRSAPPRGATGMPGDGVEG